jgi:hypothetical protein
MYVNREMRFYASIGFSECFWPCYSTSEATYRNKTITYYYNSASGTGRGNARASSPNNYPITGYVLKKYVNPNDAWTGQSATVVPKPFPIIRYAEILLAYAEALNALGGDSYTIDGETYRRDEDAIKKAINRVRYRSGLPGLLDSDMGSQSFVLSKIKKERMVEFLYENQRYFDVRRWGDYEESESVPITGMNTSGDKESYYQRVIPATTRIGNRVVSRKMLFLPIPINEMKRLPLFDQNPGW